jgi:hypothetical protein
VTEAKNRKYNDTWGKSKRRNGPLGPPGSLKDHESDVKEKEKWKYPFKARKTEQRLDG